jgi:hypothetical protein
MAEIIHPFYESHRGEMEAAMRQRDRVGDLYAALRPQHPHRRGGFQLDH